MSSFWVRVVPNPMTGVLARDRRGDGDAEEKPREDNGRGGRDAAGSPWTPGAPEGKQEEGAFPGSPGGSPALPRLHLSLWAPDPESMNSCGFGLVVWGHFHVRLIFNDIS